MVTVVYDKNFKRKIEKIKDELLKTKVKKQILKIIKDPKVGKPMKYTRKYTREVYIKPFRLSYFYNKKKDKIILLKLYHKKQLQNT